MAYQFSLTYYYITQEHDDYLTSFSEASGDSRQTLVMQYVRGWLGRNRKYYEQLAKIDVAKREMDIDEWVNVVINDGFAGMPDYRYPIADGDIPPNPLGHIVLPGNMERRDINYIHLTKQNYILLRTGIHFDGGRIAHFMSKVVHEHLFRNWQVLYLPQIQAETSNDWLKE
ncbi:hypothetical protein VF04_04205 [Nostoc linckia z7]|uniref:Uncharacterized protein n=2 Tax=Nostoc linckia TaxID=92942 RepID=A0A9Q5ZGL0_NOSLI|nr:transposase [Nostoc linckia]PHK42916.1 hypothetical protein VF12_00905 [Nostoc linckia z15]PHK48073.1 hypothetical protein VF13_01880 [Nostoc linckia z16]PHJ64993.1 hypothetical protein VF02_11690 [Nostoc linckia z1]PHJ70171.1 hypothetical protein VF05_11850 [Nostoc linckia z3]PHJ75072.1 hypothetical protein VF03_12010 [Nostoc linckia z2]